MWVSKSSNSVMRSFMVVKGPSNEGCSLEADDVAEQGSFGVEREEEGSCVWLTRHER